MKLHAKPHSDVEFSRFILIKHLPKDGAYFELSPNKDEMALLEKRIELLALKEFHAKITLHQFAGELLYRLKGTLTAKATQSCVVTNLPVNIIINEELSYLFSPENDEEGGEITNDVLDLPEPLEDGGIDIGELLTQHLILALPAFARAPDDVIEDFMKTLPKDKINMINLKHETDADSEFKGPLYEQLKKLKS